MADTTSLHLRLPKVLYKRLQRQARHNNVSLNTEIVNQLEGSEAAIAKQMAEAIRPIVADIIKSAVAQVSRLRPSPDELMLDLILLETPTPHTEASLEERLRRYDWPPERVAELLQIFRERQGGARLPPFQTAPREPEQK